MPLVQLVGMAMDVITAILTLACACILIAHVVEAYMEARPRESERRARTGPPAAC
jgi:hypothetical protein